MDKDALIELAERVEALEGPCRVVDALISREVLLPLCEPPDWLPDVFARCIERVIDGSQPDDPEIPTYTASLDAAMTLAEGLVIESISDLDMPRAVVVSDTSTSPVKRHIGECLHGQSATLAQRLALALTAASLRAMEADNG